MTFVFISKCQAQAKKNKKFNSAKKFNGTTISRKKATTKRVKDKKSN